MKKIIASSLIASVLFSQTALGAVYKVISNGEIEYKGKAEKNKAVSVVVFKPGKSISDIKMGVDLFETLAACRETVADSEGSYTVKFKLEDSDKKSGLYSVHVGYDGIDSTDDKIYYVNELSYEQKTSRFDTAEDKAKYIVENMYDMALEPELINEDCASEICNIYDNSYNSRNLTFAQITAGINKSAAIAQFNKGNVSIFGDYEAYFEIDDDLYSFMAKSYVSDIKTAIEGKISRESTSTAEFDDNLCKAFVLAAVENADGYGDVRLALEKYGYKFGIDVRRINDDVCIKLISNSYTEDTLKTAVDTFFADSDDGGSKRGDGSGGGSSVRVPSVTLEPDKNAVALEPYNADNGVFIDLDGYEWAHTAIEALKNKGILQGRENNKFFPAQNVLREEFVKMIMESIKFAPLTGEFDMSDVTEEDWYYSYIKNAYIAGIVSGMDDNRFGAGMSITREDMAVMLHNALIKKNIKMPMSDDVSINTDGASDYAVEAILSLAEAGIVHGDENGNFNPKATTTRAEAAVIVHNALVFFGRNRQ